MRVDGDGFPLPGESGRYLGVRADISGQASDGDVPVTDDGLVRPETGGMSVSPPPVSNLPLHRRPREYGGRSRDPVFEIETDGLPVELRYRPDPKSPNRHGFIEPSRTMSFENYDRAIRATRVLWRLVR